MAHEIATFDDGTAAFVSARTGACDRPGLVTRASPPAAQALATARRVR